jgi:16S rRNA C1402 N4-methylase RsmH
MGEPEGRVNGCECRVDDIQSQPLGEVRGQAKLVNIAGEIIRSSVAERNANPRSGSAKLRWTCRSP